MAKYALIDWLAETAQAQYGTAALCLQRSEAAEADGDATLAAELRGMAAGFEASAGTLQAKAREGASN